MLRIIQKRFLRSLQKKEFDYIIVGGGSAGCVLANRLSANNDVLLIEAGPRDNQTSVMAPGMAGVNLMLPNLNWYYHTVPQENLNKRKLYYPRGRVLGGSSQLNAMCYIRGIPQDRWAQLAGSEKFKYENVLPIFKKSQNAVGYGNDEYNGRDGYLKTSQHDYDRIVYGDLCRSFIKAGVQAGYPENDDPNGATFEGFGNYPTTMCDGVRQSTARAFVRPIADRLTILDRTLTSKLILQNNTVKGVEVVNSSRLRRAMKVDKYYAKEVILSGGAINTPQLLQLSGIGPKEIIEKAGVDCILHSPGVGSHLQDHLQFEFIYNCKLPVTAHRVQFTFPIEVYRWKKDPKNAILGTTFIPAFGFHKTDPTDDVANVQHHFFAGANTDHARKASYRHGFTDHVVTLQQLSRGSVNIQSNNPHHAPIIDPRCLSDPTDLPPLIKAVKQTREIFEQSAMDRYRGKEKTPGLNITTDMEIERWLRVHLESCYHPVSTCRIGTDDYSPVDSEFRLKGIDGVRIADASVMPDLMSGNTNAPTIMLAELCALDILAGN